MDQPRIFISSTAQDLAPYRARTLHAIIAAGLAPEDMVHWPASASDPVAASVEKVKSAQAVILIVAHRYGHVPDGQSLGITQLEYQTAIRHGIPVLPFVIDPKHPWPIEDVDFENAHSLRAFKADLEKRHIVSWFTTPDSLAGLVVQSLASLGQKRRVQRSFPPSVRVTPVHHASKLAIVPDVSVPVGNAEDGLPLVAYVERSKELEALFTESDLKRPDFSAEFPDRVVEELRAALSEPNRLRTVQLKTGSEQLLYVSRKNLSELFDSLLASLIERSRRANAYRRLPGHPDQHESPGNFRRHPNGQQESQGSLQSYGGLNRFLGISLQGPTLYCVGRRAGEWVEWRSFETESLCGTFPEDEFVIWGPTTFKGKLSEYVDAIQRYAFDNMNSQGMLTHTVEFLIRRQSVCRTIVEVVKAAMAHHSQFARIHGDLKPANVLLTEGRPRLIDGFDVAEGQVSPGCTPGWSAPEQILGEPVAYSTDCYSLACMMLTCLGGDMIGELTTYKVPPSTGVSTIEVLRNPVPYIEASDALSSQARRAWSAALRPFFRFDPAERASCEALVHVLESLLEQHPASGTVSLQLPSTIVAAVFEDGRHAAARLLRDDMVLLGDGVGPMQSPAVRPCPSEGRPATLRPPPFR
jgi:Domain of unknown function (DUF4062)/Protein kinase domain